MQSEMEGYGKFANLKEIRWKFERNGGHLIET